MPTSSFWAGLIAGCVLGAAVTWGLFVLLPILSYERGEKVMPGSWSLWFVGAIVLAVGAVAWLLPHNKAIMTLLLVAVVLASARSRGLLGGIVASGLAAALLAWVLPPADSIKVADMNDQILVVLLLLCGSIFSQWIGANRQFL